MLHAANQERPNSMARVISVLASPGSNDNPLRLNYEMLAPRAVTDAAIEIAEEDAQYALSPVVSREGRVQGVSVIDQPSSVRPGVNAMLNEAYRMQFVPAVDRGDAVAVSVVWLVANTTVKGRHDEDMQALRQALRLKTTPAPIAPTKTLVVNGSYRFVRNPMYVAVGSLVLGQALLFGSAAVLVYGVVVWLAVHAFVIGYEEPTLSRAYGEQYDRYRRNVRRWIPRLTPWTG